MKITFIYHKNFSPCINSIFNANAVSEIYILPLSSDAIAPTASHLPNLRGAHLHNLLVTSFLKLFPLLREPRATSDDSE